MIKTSARETLVAGGVRYETIRLTPDVAADWLRNNHCNRPLNGGKVKQMVAAMLAGRFPNIGQPIIFGTSGRMLNGQHRCHAVVKSGATIEITICRGVDDAHMPLIDAGANRTLRDVLVIEGWAPWQASVGATTARYAIGYEAGVKINQSVANDVGRDYIFNHPDVMSSVEFIAQLPRNPAPIPHSLAAFLHYTFRLVSRDQGAQADNFIRQFWTGEELTSDNIILQVRNRLIARSMSGHRATVEELAQAVIRVWNSIRANRPIKHVNNAFRIEPTMPRAK